MANEVKVPCGGFKIASDQFYFDENGALNPTLTGGGMSDEFVVETTNVYNATVTVNGKVYRKIGEFPTDKDIFSYATFSDEDRTKRFSLSSLTKTDDNEYYVGTNWCCSEKNIYYLSDPTVGEKMTELHFYREYFSIHFSNNSFIEGFSWANISPLGIKIKQATLGDLSWFYNAVGDHFIFCFDSNFVVGILFGVEQSRGMLTYKYYDFTTSSLYGVSTGIRNWFDQTLITTAMRLATSQLNLRSPNGTPYKITVSNDGVLSVATIS